MSYNQNDAASTDVNLRPKCRLVPNVGIATKSFVFDIIERELEPNVIYRVGRFSDRNALSDRLSFKSKVVSRNHAEIWTEQGKVFIRDIGSSSGTFLNRLRLSQPSQVSMPHELRDGDLIQLGVDYQGGMEAIYRAVRIRIEINRQDNPFTRTAFQQLRNQFISNDPDLSLAREPTKIPEPSDTTDHLSSMLNHLPHSKLEVQECCICLYAIAPFQALFIAPCSHVYHFKCLRPIIAQHYPGFSCPLCRNYFDLEASVAVEVEEVIALRQQTQDKKIDTVPEESDAQKPDETIQLTEPPRRQGEHVLSTTLVSSPTFHSNTNPHHRSE